LTNTILAADVFIFNRAFDVGGGGQHGGVSVNSHLLVRYVDG
jgi:hypothetical protein